jgi:hypothetical protein
VPTTSMQSLHRQDTTQLTVCVYLLDSALTGPRPGGSLLRRVFDWSPHLGLHKFLPGVRPTASLSSSTTASQRTPKDAPQLISPPVYPTLLHVRSPSWLRPRLAADDVHRHPLHIQQLSFLSYNSFSFYPYKWQQPLHTASARSVPVENARVATALQRKPSPSDSAADAAVSGQRLAARPATHCVRSCRSLLCCSVPPPLPRSSIPTDPTMPAPLYKDLLQGHWARLSGERSS